MFQWCVLIILKRERCLVMNNHVKNKISILFRGGSIHVFEYQVESQMYLINCHIKSKLLQFSHAYINSLLFDNDRLIMQGIFLAWILTKNCCELIFSRLEWRFLFPA